ncbi:MerR family transcriptional regulator [Neorhizobium sp. T25_13]|uniref:MerR family transcriptional regulator n=1 Tax=Neorhizobium sp. T25_13 TaxID=2093830 RepID=UPI00197B95DD|nr:MerR family transcriptional regulator [Neorhizobium sp. T25_13]
MMDNRIRYKIAEAARMAGVSPSTLRLWESQGLVDPVRTDSGQRLYDSAHVERLKRISWLRLDKGLNPAAIRETLKSEEQDGTEETPAEVGSSSGGRTIGAKLRHLRREMGCTLEKVAATTGIASSLLSTFERTSQGLSVKALHDLAGFYGTTIAALTGQAETSARESLVRNGDWTAWPPTSSGVTVQNLTIDRRQMECHRFQLAPGASSEGAYSHAGEEFLHVLVGRMELILDGDQFFELREGDSFYFESRRPHSWRNSNDGETVLIWVNTPPTF